MNRIKLVLWERKMAHQQASYLLQQETAKAQGQQASVETFQQRFPLAVEEVGRDRARSQFRLQDKFKGDGKKRALRALKKVSNNRWFIE